MGTICVNNTKSEYEYYLKYQHYISQYKKTHLTFTDIFNKKIDDLQIQLHI